MKTPIRAPVSGMDMWDFAQTSIYSILEGEAVSSKALSSVKDSTPSRGGMHSQEQQHVRRRWCFGASGDSNHPEGPPKEIFKSSGYSCGS